MFCYISFQLYKVITLKRSINGLISVINFKRTMTNISFNITYLQDNYLGTYVSMNKVMTDTQMVAVLTYLCTLCFLLRASDWTSNVQRRQCRILPFTRNCSVTSAPWVWSWSDGIRSHLIWIYRWSTCGDGQAGLCLYCSHAPHSEFS